MIRLSKKHSKKVDKYSMENDDDCTHGSVKTEWDIIIIIVMKITTADQ